MTTSTPKSRPATKYERRREEIMFAAAAVFAEKGFHGASTQDIADRLDMKQGSLYYYFPSKEAALEAVCLYGLGEVLTRLRQVVDADLALQEKVRQVVLDQLHGLETRCDHWVVFMQQRRFLPAEPREHVREMGREYRRLLTGMLRDAQRQGEVEADLDVDLAARALIGMCDSVALWYQRDSSLDIERIADQYYRMFYRGISS